MEARERDASHAGSGDLALGRDRLRGDHQQRHLCRRDLHQRDWTVHLLHPPGVSGLAGERLGEGGQRGPWHLGRFGSRINAVAMLWVVFITVILAIPDNMRAGKTIAGLTVALSAWYLLTERHRFRGPAWSAQQTAPPVSSTTI